MYKKACEVVVLRSKPVAFLMSWLPSPSSLLKLPNKVKTTLVIGEVMGRGGGGSTTLSILDLLINNVKVWQKII